VESDRDAEPVPDMEGTMHTNIQIQTTDSARFGPVGNMIMWGIVIALLIIMYGIGLRIVYNADPVPDIMPTSEEIRHRL